MTLPFRRRHNDAEASHDRARSLISAAMIESIEAQEEAWLDAHLEGCHECRRDRERYLADRELVRSLRGTAPPPPRDLWARTAAAIEREAHDRGRPRLAARGGRPVRRGRPFLASLPVSAASGLLVVVVVVGAAIVSQRVPILPPLPNGSPGGTEVAGVTIQPGPTPIMVDVADVRWLRATADGNYDFVVADVDEVCPGERAGCPRLEQSVRTPVKLGGQPVGVTLSPVRPELVVIAGSDGEAAGKVLVVPVPEPEPAITPGVVDTPSPPASDLPQPTAEGTREIASDVVVVGEPAYSSDGQWLAFSARPSDLSTGPDLYLWRAGTTEAAQAVTSDHRTYFSSWLGNQVLASRVETIEPEPLATDDAGGSEATAEPTADPAADASEAPSEAPSEEPVGGGAAAPLEGRPASFLLDPETLSVTNLAEPDVWLPVVDETGRIVVFWSGTVVSAGDGTSWLPATGRLLLDRWAGVDDGTDVGESPAPSPGAPEATVGPAGEAVVLAEGPVAAFDARFDPDGTRLGLWTLRPDEEHGRLQLLVVDPEAGSIDDSLRPLEGVPAVRGFSINKGRLAWVTPPGQDGDQSSVQVLAWKDRSFGHVETIPAPELIVLR